MFAGCSLAGAAPAHCSPQPGGALSCKNTPCSLQPCSSLRIQAKCLSGGDFYQCKPVSATGRHGSAGMTTVGNIAIGPLKGWVRYRTCLNAPKNPQPGSLVSVLWCYRCRKEAIFVLAQNPPRAQLQPGIPRRVWRPEKIDGICWTNYSAPCKATWLLCLLAKVEHKAV